MTFSRPALASLCTLLIACAPQAEEEVSSGEYDVRARVDGLTVWLDATAHPELRDGRRVWVLGGRASRDVKHVFAFVPDDPFGTAQVVSARRFELVLDDASEINSLLSGLPLFVRVTPERGEPAFAGVWMAPRFAHFAGTSRLHVGAAVDTVWVAGELIYRGRVSTSAGSAVLRVAGEAPPRIVAEDVDAWKLDWTFDELRGVAGETVSFATGRLEKRATLELAVLELRLTRDDPYEVWQTTCEPEVRACLAALPVEQVDTEACGSYRQVLWCGGTVGARASFTE